MPRMNTARKICSIFPKCSIKTIWRTFESCNNYKMPTGNIAYPGKLQYWYGEKEAGERKADLKYVKEHFPHTEIIKFDNLGHGGLVTLYPEKMADRLKDILHS